MKIASRYTPDRRVFSFEFFPPHTEAGSRSLLRTVGELRMLEPDFVSVTYPLDRARRELTLELVEMIQRDIGLDAMAHLTCVNATREEVHGVLRRLERSGIENVLALRGDVPADEEIVVPRQNWFGSSVELARHIREHFRFCMGGAAHPEVHPDADSPETDVAFARAKVEAGCEFLITQLFLDNADYFAFVERARAAGISVPIVPGIMPITSYQGILRMARLNGHRIPAPLREQLEEAADDPQAVARVGVAWARTQCIELLEGGAPGLHFFTLNRSPATRQILTFLRDRLD
ncbi:MAG: methylenetetrahydrofolate reductase [NAD(P)H] [Myxococcota bacterium]